VGWSWHEDRQAAILANAAKQSIIVTDFENKTGDPIFDTTLTDGFTAQLEQSPVLKLVGEQHLRESLKYLGKSSDSELTPEVRPRAGAPVFHPVTQRPRAGGPGFGGMAAFGFGLLVYTHSKNALGLKTWSFAWLALHRASRLAQLEVESAIQVGIAYRRGLVDIDRLLIGIIERQRAVRIKRLELKDYIRVLRMHRSARVGPPANGKCQSHQRSIAQPRRQAAGYLTLSLLFHRWPPSFLTSLEQNIGLEELCAAKERYAS
jgi:hypothetical protein